METHCSKFYWEGDFSNDVVIDGPLEREIDKKPTGKYLKKCKFSDEIMQPIVELIRQHITDNNVIAIVGDYDVDGTTSTTILMKALQALGANVTYEVPNRFIDGYGISNRIIDLLVTEQVRLIITVDNGIAATEQVKYARKKGVDVIVTDHHEVGEIMPCANAILHPSLDATLDQTPICGAVVAYLLAEVLIDLLEKEQKQTLMNEFLQLTCLATLADMMPLQHVNRDVTFLGYKLIQQQPLPFLQAYQKESGCTAITSSVLSYQLNPMINAVGRMADSNLVVEAMLSNHVGEIIPHITTFLELNEERKIVTNGIFEEAYADFLAQKNEIGFYLGVGENWHQGVLGIVAQKLMQKVQQPVILLTNAKDDVSVYTGSARAFSGYNVYECFSDSKEFLVKFGGHKYAGGLTIEKSNIAAFKKHLQQFNQQLDDKLSLPEKQIHLTIDSWKTLKKLDSKFLTMQKQYEPFGEKNKPFSIGVHKVRVLAINEMGTTKRHVKLQVEEHGKTYPVVAFEAYNLLEDIAPFSFVDLCIQVQENYFNGQTSIQFLLEDIKYPCQQIFDYRSIKYQSTNIDAQETDYIIDHVPLDAKAFLAELAQSNFKRIYLKKMSFEDLFAYEKQIPKSAYNFVFKVIMKKGKLDLNDDSVFLAFYKRKLPKSIVLYIIQVFFDLDFVIIDGYICKINDEHKKQPLEVSKIYNAAPQWLQFRNLILFEPVDELQKFIAKE